MRKKSIPDALSACAAAGATARIEPLEPRTLLSGTTVRIDAGGPAYTDTAGNKWIADTDYSGGSTTNSAYAVANTSDDPLFYSRRWGNFSYNIPVASGSYTLSLYFAEPRDTGPNQRIFDVSAEGEALLTNFDIYAAAGYQTALIKTFNLTVTDGTLNLNFLSIKDSACIDAIAIVPASSSSSPLGSPWTDTDIGSVGVAGSATINTSGAITVNGSGANIAGDTDAFNFAYQTLTGNGSVIAQVTSEGDTDPWAKAGIMIRETINDDSRNVMLALTPGNGAEFTDRGATHNSSSNAVTASASAGEWLELTRSGSTFAAYVSTNGSSWSKIGSATIPMVNNVEVGLCVSAHNSAQLMTGTFANVSIAATGTTASAWTNAATAPSFRWESQSVTYNNKLYVFGGFTDRTLDATADCEVFNPATNTWSFLTDIPVGALTHAGTALVGNTVYFVGGDIGTFTYGKTKTATTDVLTYNLDTNKWGTSTSLPVAISCGGLVDINNVLYYYGGINSADNADLSTTYALNLSNTAAGWVAKAPMPDARNHLGYAEINGIAYAVGGQHLYAESTGNDSQVDAYNPATNSWTQVASLPQTWSSFHVSTIVINNKIVIVGGQTNGGYDGIYQNLIDEFNPATNRWSNVGTLPEANEGLAVAYINSELIAADGTVDNLGGWATDQTWIDKSLSF
jgi:N-acetylneuraminic acid mutarotase